MLRFGGGKKSSARRKASSHKDKDDIQSIEEESLEDRLSVASGSPELSTPIAYKLEQDHSPPDTSTHYRHANEDSDQSDIDSEDVQSVAAAEVPGVVEKKKKKKGWGLKVPKALRGGGGGSSKKKKEAVSHEPSIASSIPDHERSEEPLVGGLPAEPPNGPQSKHAGPGDSELRILRARLDEAEQQKLNLEVERDSLQMILQTKDATIVKLKEEVDQLEGQLSHIIPESVSPKASGKVDDLATKLRSVQAALEMERTEKQKIQLEYDALLKQLNATRHEVEELNETIKNLKAEKQHVEATYMQQLKDANDKLADVQAKHLADSGVASETIAQITALEKEVQKWKQRAQEVEREAQEAQDNRDSAKSKMESEVDKAKKWILEKRSELTSIGTPNIEVWMEKTQREIANDNHINPVSSTLLTNFLDDVVITRTLLLNDLSQHKVTLEAVQRSQDDTLTQLHQHIAQLTQEKADLLDTLDTTNAALQEKQGAITSLQTTLKSTHTELEAHTGQLTHLQSQLQTANTTLKETQDELQLARSKCTALQQALDDTETRASSTDTELKSLNTQLLAKTEELTVAQQTISALRSELAAAEAVQTEAHSMMSKRLQQQEAEIEALRTQLSTHVESVEVEKQHRQSLEVGEKALVAKLRDLETQGKTHESEKRALEDEVDALKAQIQAQKEEAMKLIAESEGIKLQMASVVDERVADSLNLQKRLDTKSRRVEELEEAVELLKSSEKRVSFGRTSSLNIVPNPGTAEMLPITSKLMRTIEEKGDTSTESSVSQPMEVEVLQTQLLEAREQLGEAQRRLADTEAKLERLGSGTWTSFSLIDTPSMRPTRRPSNSPTLEDVSSLKVPSQATSLRHQRSHSLKADGESDLMNKLAMLASERAVLAESLCQKDEHIETLDLNLRETKDELETAKAQMKKLADVNKEIEMNHSNAEQRVTQLQAELQGLIDAREQYLLDIEKLQEELGDVEKERAELIHSLALVRDAKEKLDSDNAALKARCQAYEAEAGPLKSNFKSMEVEYAAKESAIAELESKTALLESQVVALKTAQEQSRVELERKRVNEVNEIEAERVRAVSEVETLKATCAALEQEVTYKESELEDLQSALQTMKEHHLHLQEELASVGQCVAEMLSEARADLGSGDETMKEPPRKVVGGVCVVFTCAGSRGVVTHIVLQQQTLAWKSDLDMLKKTQEEERKRMSLQVQSLQNLLLERENQLKDKDGEAEALERKCKRQAEELTKLNLVTSSSDTELNSLRTENLQLKNELDELQITRDKLTREVESAKRQEEALADRLKVLTQDEDEGRQHLMEEAERNRVLAETKEKELSQVTSKLAEVQAQNRRLQDELKAVQDKCSGLEAQINTLKTELTGAQKAGDAEMSKVNHAKTQAEKDVNTLRSQLEQIREKLMEAEVRCKTLQNEKDDLESLKVTLESRVSRLQKAMDESTKQVKDSENYKVTQLEETVQELRTSKKTLSQQLNAKTLELAKIENEMSLLTMKQGVLESANKELQQQVKLLSDKGSELSTVMSAKELDLQRQILELNGVKEVQHHQIASYQQRETELKKDLSESKQEAERLHDRMGQAKKELSSVQIELSILERKHQDLTQENAQLKSLNDELKRTSASVLQDTLKSSQQQTFEVEKLRMKAQQLERANEDLSREIDNLSQRLSESESAKSSMRMDLETVKQKLNHTEEDMRSLEKKLANSEAQIGTMKVSLQEAFKRETNLTEELAMVKKEKGAAERRAKDLLITRDTLSSEDVVDPHLISPGVGGPPAATIFSNCLASVDGAKTFRWVRCPEGTLEVVLCLKQRLIECLFETFAPRMPNGQVLGGMFREVFNSNFARQNFKECAERPEVLRVLSRVRKLWELGEDLRLALVQGDPTLAEVFQLTRTTHADWESTLAALRGSAEIIEERNRTLEKLSTGYAAALEETKTMVKLDREKAKTIVANLKKQLHNCEEMRTAAEAERDELLKENESLQSQLRATLQDNSRLLNRASAPKLEPPKYIPTSYSQGPASYTVGPPSYNVSTESITPSFLAPSRVVPKSTPITNVSTIPLTSNIRSTSPLSSLPSRPLPAATQVFGGPRYPPTTLVAPTYAK
eukprot:Blabericola_migrator_1__8697@NODE_457_length_8311_cov_49_879791_g358_i0_p1_GENE_NODE_457_length_8311_cov_49_879791_g358_i0NODE_457_length_8311_cov_49_879791_g358_i0_p1_ORF_typecomplete_len2107_score571_63HOOK/PF05622_12/0_38HOOK/PF05622_12/0_00024HOOK/PF05622_12/0_61HOOK/PF05622_12/1e05HOOK/PF05622_12/5_3e05HOOK/PF05622_12/0_00018HOOK/PF05622_12/0_1Myosin_tail_1/PF01576_19/0_00031Myosin_tail_1/PF01576_19/0_0025Myosin_tail_1/PF01576_19/3_4e05Myosin_tail_1/PF01576_19/1_1e03Myosin_tail_1/PF01576_19